MNDDQLTGLERLAKYQARVDSKIVPLTADIILQFVDDYRSMQQRAEAAEAALTLIDEYAAARLADPYNDRLTFDVWLQSRR